MKDEFGRSLQYLRISVTDRCNLRCGYCMPEEGVPTLPHAEILRYDEIVRVVRVMAGLGVRRVRLTGGEPLVRKDLPALAAQVKQVEGIGFLGLTTNGLLLPRQGPALAQAGVDGVNLSLDTTHRQRYALLARRDELPRAMEGLRAALALPFSSVKVNCVLAPQSTPEDWLGVAALARDLPVDVRFIEWMPLAGEGAEAKPAVGSDDALAALAAAFGPLAPLPHAGGAGPAQYYAVAGFKGRVGIIPAMSHPFCGSCNRLRLTATGDLKLCLFYDTGLPLKPLLRGGASDAELAGAIRQAVRQKPRHHGGCPQTGTQPGDIRHPGGMYQIGG